MASAVNTALEALRQSRALDRDFYKRSTYFFELKVPERLSNLSTNSFLFPILLPQGYEMEEPFTVEKTPTQGGGLSVEENGIVQRTIRIRGTTGFKPRQVKGNYKGALTLVSPEKRSHSRMLPSAIVEDKLSGQRHFQYLNDAVFRTYADLKRDPATAEGTELIFHNPKEQEHWRVIPENFKLTRDKSQATLYNYDITMTAVGQANSELWQFSEDRGVLNTMRDSLQMVQSGIDLASGAVNDITAVVGELSRLIKDVGTIISNVTTILEAASDFAAGVTSLIEAPYALINETGDLLEAGMQAYADLEALDVTDIGENMAQKFNTMLDGLERIGSQPEAFETQTDVQLRETKKRQEVLTSASASTIATAEDTPAPDTLADSADLGTTMTEGDIESARGELGIGRQVLTYTGAQEVSVEQGDTLVNLAAKYLGDARLWQQIAALNGIKPPFIDDLASAPLSPVEQEALPGALGVGRKIMIPNFSKPPSAMAQLPILGVRAEEDAETHMMGRDVQLTKVSGRTGAPQFDWAIDTEGGSVDLKTVKGRNNLGQGLEFRLRVEKGSDILYKQMGLERVIGLNGTAADLEMVRFRIAQCVQQDPRVANVREVVLEDGGDTSVEADITAEIRGFADGITIRPAL